MNKICTDINQSQKLIELGIDVKTADMFWDTLFAKKPEAQVNNHHYIDEYDDEHRVPAWSLAALLDILPYPTLAQHANGLWSLTALVGTVEPYSVCGYDNKIDACYELILKLHELKML